MKESLTAEEVVNVYRELRQAKRVAGRLERRQNLSANPDYVEFMSAIDEALEVISPGHILREKQALASTMAHNLARESKRHELLFQPTVEMRELSIPAVAHENA